MTGNWGSVASCLSSRLGSARPRLDLGALLREGWRSLEWQLLKRLIAEALAECICSATGREVYLADIHGGEPSPGLGGKDVDLIVQCLPPEEAAEVEEAAEKAVAAWLEGLLGETPYRVLGVPNIVEVHSSHEFIFSRYVRAGPPYAVKLCGGASQK